MKLSPVVNYFVENLYIHFSYLHFDLEKRSRIVSMPAQCFNFVATALCKCNLSAFVTSWSQHEVNSLLFIIIPHSTNVQKWTAGLDTNFSTY